MVTSWTIDTKMAAVAFNIGMAFIYICKKKKKEKESGNKYFTLTVLFLQLLLLLNTVTATIETPMAAAAFKFLVAFINIYERPIEILLQTRLCIFYL